MFTAYQRKSLRIIEDMQKAFEEEDFETMKSQIAIKGGLSFFQSTLF